MSATLQWTVCIVAAYLAGSIPFGLLLGLARGVDIRQHGSKNIGATNAGRVLGRPWGVLCFVLDVLKGAAPVALAGWWMRTIQQPSITATEAALWLGVAAAAVLGHVFPVFLRFKGGKGVATGFGALLGVWGYLTLPALGALAIWVISVRVTRYVSVASILAAASIPVFTVLLAASSGASRGVSVLAAVAERWPFVAITAVLGTLVIVRHRANIARLIAGKEPKIGGKAPRPETALKEA
ncbi:MAG: glycerol-3-phosphate 1-O-acyltransferase PlsY [Planctomycetota bacterium]|nr:glycerol-3-phosphate 1-O-acyltransferase PlsY [Planctomycetota bacterium]